MPLIACALGGVARGYLLLRGGPCLSGRHRIGGYDLVPNSFLCCTMGSSEEVGKLAALQRLLKDAYVAAHTPTMLEDAFTG